ncbi:MAG: SWIM zinc finger domain-containing protein [Anaerolineae bacterium]
MSAPAITEATIRRLASPQSFSRGKDYFLDGTVLELSKRGHTLQAQVEGSGYQPYEVTVELSEGGIEAGHCSCPYDWGGYCKHIVAALLAYVEEPQRVVERPPVEELLTGLNHDGLLELVRQLLSEQPRLADWVEAHIAAATSIPAPQPELPHQGRPPVDVAPYRRQARQILRPGDRYWGVGRDIATKMETLIGKTYPFIEEGDGRNALRVLEAITDPLVGVWFEYDEEGELAYLFGELGNLFAEAILSTDLSAEERRQWAATLTNWQGDIEEYGVEEGFDVAIAAAKLGWDYPPLQAVLRGNITSRGAWEDDAPWYADDLALVRLQVLERQGRTTEYLYLAEAEGQNALYMTMLVKLGRSHEAVAYAQKYMTTTDEAISLAQALRDHNHRQDALHIATHGLTLHGNTLNLARWLRDFAAATDHPNTALKAARIAFSQSYSLEDYQAAAAVAGAKWPQQKRSLLKQLAAAEVAYGKIDIYLHEGMIDEAIKTVDRLGYAGYYTLEPVVEAAWQSHPDWVIKQCKKQAETIMDGGKSKYYRQAVNWLQKVQRTCIAAGRTAEWDAYLESLIQKHHRKYSLRPQLEALRQSAMQ